SAVCFSGDTGDCTMGCYRSRAVLPAPLDAAVNAAAVTGQESGGINTTGIVDDIMGGGISFVGEVTCLDEPSEALLLAAAEFESYESIGIRRVAVTVVDVGFHWYPLEGGPCVPSARVFP